MTTNKPSSMSRRAVMLLGATGVVATFLGLRPMTKPALAMKKELQLDPRPESIEPFELDDVEWKARLSEEAYYVLRKEGTERPFTSVLNDEKRDGDFACAGCNLVLFDASTKYESGTGWPSFWQPVEGHIETKTDFKLLLPRKEYHCARCGGHQGHVFKDGPQPTGLRYCNNGVALKFVPNPELEAG